MELRQVSLHESVPGTLFLSHMPGKHESLQTAFSAVREHDVDDIMCLASIKEIAEKSPAYADAIGGHGEPLPCKVTEFSVPDYGVPGDLAAAEAAIDKVAAWLRSGRRILVHCSAGVQRTGMFASCVLIRLGMQSDAAAAAIKKAGSTPTTVQREFIALFERSTGMRDDSPSGDDA